MYASKDEVQCAMFVRKKMFPQMRKKHTQGVLSCRIGVLARPEQFVCGPWKGYPVLTLGLTRKRMRSWGGRGGGFHGFDGTLGNVTSWLQFFWEPWPGSGSLGHRTCLSFLIKHISLLCGPKGMGWAPTCPLTESCAVPAWGVPWNENSGISPC